MSFNGATARAIIKDVGIDIWKPDSYDFGKLLDALKDANCQLLRKRSRLLEGWRDGMLYCCSVDTNADVLCKHPNHEDLKTAFSNAMLSKKTQHVQLPAFCLINEENACVLLWTRSDIRCAGIGTNFLRRLKITETSRQSDGAREFFEKRQIYRQTVQDAYGIPYNPKKRKCEPSSQRPLQHESGHTSRVGTSYRIPRRPGAPSSETEDMYLSHRVAPTASPEHEEGEAARNGRWRESPSVSPQA